jgi:hypothetical protein
MKIFSDFDVYEHKYTYDEAKVMCVIGECCWAYDDFDYEDLCRIAEAIYAHWANDDERSEEKVEEYPWLEFQSFEEEGYIQKYASRVVTEFIKLYKEEYLH